MQHARDVRRRDDNRVRIAGMCTKTGRALEITGLVPLVEKRLLMRREVVIDFLVCHLRFLLQPKESPGAHGRRQGFPS